MKKIMAILLAGMMVISLASCSSASNSSAASQGQETETSESVNVVEQSENIGDANDQSTDESSIEDSSAEDSEAEAAEKNDTLILYFSANNRKNSDVDAVTSATPMADGKSSAQQMAEMIQEIAGGDIVPIIPSEDYPFVYNDVADQAKKERDDDARPAFEDLGVDPTSYKKVFIGYPIWWYEMPMIMDTLFDTYDFKGVTIIPFNTHEGSGNGGTYSDIQELEPGATVLEGLAIRGSSVSASSKDEIQKWLDGLDLD